MFKRRSSSSLWSNRSFVLYYLFNLLSYFGSGITVVALPLYIYKQTGSPIYTSLVAVFTGLPYLLFGLFAGALADRGNRRAIMVGCSLFSGLMLMSIPIAASITGEASPVHLLAAGLCISTAFVWFDAASHGALLHLVGRAQLVAANSLLTSTDTITRIGSPAVAGFVIYRFGPEWALGIDAVCYLISALLILSMSDSIQRKRTDVKAASSAIDEGSLLRKLRSDIKEGLDFIWGQPIIRMLTLLGFGNSFVGGAVTGLIVVFGAKVLGFADSAPQMSTLFVCGSFGALIASVSLPLLRRRIQPGKITLSGLGLSGLSLFGVATGGPLTLVYICYMIWNLSYIMIIINGITLRQQLTPDSLQGRVHASGRMIAWGGYPFGSLIGGIGAEWLGIQSIYGLLALIVLLLLMNPNVWRVLGGKGYSSEYPYNQ